MKKIYLTKLIFALMLGFSGLTNANAQFLQDTKTVDIVEIPAFDGDGAIAQRYLADTGDVITFSLDQNENSQWYRIPAGGVSNGTENVQAYYYKNFSTGNYLYINDETLAKLEEERGGDWPIGQATASAANEKSLAFQWFERPSNWGWGIYLSNASNIDLDARENNQIFSVTSITLMGGPDSDFFGVNFPNAAVNGFAGGGGNAWTAVKTPVVVKSGETNPDYSGSASVLELSLDDVIVWGGDPANTYNPATQTITFNKDWNGGAGWDVEGLDLSAYTHVTVEFANAQGGYVRLTTEYDEDPWGEEKGSNDPSEITVALDLDRIDVIKRVALGVNGADNEGGRQVVLKRAYLWNEFEGLQYSLDRLNFFASDGGEDANAASYDPATQTITYKDSWRRAGWNWESEGGLDIAGQGYDQVLLELDATMLPASGEGEGRAKLQFDVEYMDGSKEEAPAGGGWEGGNEYRAGDTQVVWWSLTKANTQKIKLITLKSEVPGDVVLKKAYFAANTVDLIISDIWWEPANPKQGDEVVFFATIKNIGGKSSPSGIKHGIAFAINNQIYNTWCDAFFGPLGPGEEKELSTTMEGSSGKAWTVGNDASYTIKAQVNDQKEITESDYDNNFFEKVLSVTTGIKEILANSGNVYYADGALQVSNYPASAILRVYNLAGVNVSGSLSVSEIKRVNLYSGIYVVEVQSEGKTFAHKVIVK